MTDPNAPKPMTPEEIDRRIAEIEASLAASTPKPPPAAPAFAEPETASAPDPQSPPPAFEEPRPRRRPLQADAVFEEDETPPRRESARQESSRAATSFADSQIVERAIGISRFSPRYYADVMADGGATVQAATVVVAVAVASGIGGLGAGLGGFFASLVWALIKWVLFTVSAWIVARSVFDKKPDGDVTALARVLGFAQAPGLLAIVGFIPFLGWSLAAVGNLWLVLAVVMGLRNVLNLDFRQSFLTAIGAWVAATVIAILLAMVFGGNPGSLF
ncbi:MAG TPA: Yip1 family protein [Thermomicrobiales bacterium]|nr:Yip1 family protein [Thermomicrobiales bacterium]